jgi:hypothetical protein
MKYQNEQAYFLLYEFTGEQHFLLYDITGSPHYLRFWYLQEQKPQIPRENSYF